MISDFWDVQAGARYRAEKVEREQQGWDTEEKVDGVLGLHGLAPYFFETDAYVYAGADNYAAFSLETERDLLLTQKLIFKPYLDLNIIFSDDSKYAKNRVSVVQPLVLRHVMRSAKSHALCGHCL